jgi:predicted nucleotidyltransferase
MIQLKKIDQLQKMFPNVKGIDVALLYGSFGRNEATPNSDIDIQLLVNKDFETSILKDNSKNYFTPKFNPSVK